MADLNLHFVSVEATGEAGSLSVTSTVIDLSLVGVAATGEVGSFIPAALLAGVAGTCQVGSFGIEIQPALAGVEAAAAVGDLTGLSSDVNISLSAVASAAAAGTFGISKPITKTVRIPPPTPGLEWQAFDRAMEPGAMTGVRY